MDWRAHFIERARWARERGRRAGSDAERREWEVLAEIYERRASEVPPESSVH